MGYCCEICGERYSHPVGRTGTRWCVFCNLAIKKVTEHKRITEDAAAEHIRLIKNHLQRTSGFVIPSVVIALIYIDFEYGIRTEKLK